MDWDERKVPRPEATNERKFRSTRKRCVGSEVEFGHSSWVERPGAKGHTHTSTGQRPARPRGARAWW